jgi:hypothetical protein
MLRRLLRQCQSNEFRSCSRRLGQTCALSWRDKRFRCWACIMPSRASVWLATWQNFWTHKCYYNSNIERCYLHRIDVFARLGTNGQVVKRGL